MTKIAICYWGMTRSTRFVYKTHESNLYDVLKDNNIDYDIFMHTWETDNNIVWEKKYDNPIDYEEYKLLNPTYYEKQKQDEFLDTIIFNNYFDEELYNKYGDSQHEWIPTLIRNHLCALESQKRVYHMVLKTKEDYDYILFVRPDVKIENNFDHTILNEDFDIVIPSDVHNEGYNDTFAIIPFKKAEKYSTRIDEIIDFRKNNGRIVSEKYVKFIIDKYYQNVKQTHFFMKLIRPDGQES
jgi:hypothetical protein